MSIDTTDRRPGAYRSVTRLVIALMATLFVIGCGSSRGEYVHPGPGPGPGVNTGTLIYNFNVNPQMVLDVPGDIEYIDFDLHNAPNGAGSVIDSRILVPFSNSITLNNVSTAVESSVLTFYNEFDFPVYTATVNVDVFADQITVVDFTGVVGEVPTFDALTVTPDPLALDSGETEDLFVEAAFGNGDFADLTSDDMVAAGVTFVSADPAVATVDADGVVTGVASGSTVITAELTTNGATHSDTVNVVVDAAIGVLDYITVEPATLTVLLSGGDQQLTVTGFDALDNEVVIDLADFDIASSDVAVLTVDGTGLITPVAAGVATVTVTNTADPTITASSEITVSAATVDSIAFVDAVGDPITTNLELYVSEAGALSVTANLSDNTTIANFEEQGSLTITAGDDYLRLIDGEFVAVNEATGETVTVSVDTGVTTGGAAVTENITVDVRRVQLTDVVVSIGGIEVDLADATPSASIPEGYTGVLEVIGTFEDGSVRELAGGIGDLPVFDANDYSITLVGNYTRTTFTGFQTNEQIRADGNDGDSGEVTIEFAAFYPDMNDITIDLETVSDALEATGHEASFANYSDDPRLIEGANGPHREIDVRGNFTALQGFRIANVDIDSIAGANDPGILSDMSFGGWSAITIAGTTNFSDDVVVNIIGGQSATIEGVESVNATYVGIGETAAVTPVTTDVGTTLSYSTFVDYDDGDGAVDRTADYPVLESRDDFVYWVYVTFEEYLSGPTASNFFVKSTTAGATFDVEIRDRTAITVDAVGTGVDLVEINVN